MSSSVEVASHSPVKNIFLELSLISRLKFKSFDFAEDFFRSISKNKNLHLKGAILASSPEQAITLAKQKAKERDTDEIMIIGGGYIYNEFIVNSDRLYITEVDMEVEGDVFFPKIDSSKFKEISREENQKKQKMMLIIRW